MRYTRASKPRRTSAPHRWEQATVRRNATNVLAGLEVYGGPNEADPGGIRAPNPAQRADPNDPVTITITDTTTGHPLATATVQIDTTSTHLVQIHPASAGTAPGSPTRWPTSTSRT